MHRFQVQILLISNTKFSTLTVRKTIREKIGNSNLQCIKQCKVWQDGDLMRYMIHALAYFAWRGCHSSSLIQSQAFKKVNYNPSNFVICWLSLIRINIPSCMQNIWNISIFCLADYNMCIGC